MLFGRLFYTVRRNDGWEYMETEEWDIEEFPSHRFHCDGISEGTVMLRLRGDDAYFTNPQFKWNFLEAIEFFLYDRRLDWYDSTEMGVALQLHTWRTLPDPTLFEFQCPLLSLPYPANERQFSIQLTRKKVCPSGRDDCPSKPKR